MVKPGYKQTEIGVIPEDWDVGFFDDFGKVSSGGTPNTTVSNYWNGSIVWCTPSDITKTRSPIIVKTERSISEIGLANSAAILLPANSLLLCTRATIGEAKINGIPMATNQGFKNLTPNEHSDIKFIYYLLQTKRKQMIEKAIGSTFLEISKSALCSIPLPIPSYPEQMRIAEVLSEIENYIISLEQLIIKKRAIKQGAMQELLTGKKRLPGFHEKWKSKSIDELCLLVTKQTGFDYTMHIKPALSTLPLKDHIPFIQNKDFEDTHINYKTSFFIPVHVAKKFPNIRLIKPCLLISLSGRIGNVGFYDGSEIAFVGGAIGIAHFYNPEIAKWAMKFLLSTNGQKTIFKNEKAGAQHNLTVEDVRKIQIPLPEEAERECILAIIDSFDNEIYLLEHKLLNVQQIKQGIMHQLLTGKIRLT